MKMTPDGTVSWRSSDVHSHQGVLLQPIDNSKRNKIAAETVLGFARMSRSELAQQDKIEAGRWGTVFRVGGMAIKVFNSEELWDYETTRSIDHLLGRDALRANIIMAEGLRRSRAKGLGLTWEKTQLLHSAPEISACFISSVDAPTFEPYPDTSRAVWAMSYEDGIPGNKYNGVLPDAQLLAEYYDEAIQLCGARPHDISYDDNRTRSNEILRVDENGTLSEIVKIDVTADMMRSWQSTIDA